MKKLIDFQHFGNISTDSKSPVFFLSGLIYPYILTKNSKVNKTSNFFEDFWCRKQFFEKNITGQQRQLIVLNPFLDSLGNFALKNIGLPPGVGLECFQSSQDAVKRHLVFLVLGKYNFGLELSCSVIRALSKEIVWLGCSYERARFILKLPFRKIPMPRSKSLN